MNQQDKIYLYYIYMMMLMMMMIMENGYVDDVNDELS